MFMCVSLEGASKWQRALSGGGRGSSVDGLKPNSLTHFPAELICKVKFLSHNRI